MSALVVPRLLQQPSYAGGYARHAVESAYPKLWDRLLGAYVPGLGCSGVKTLPDVSPYRNHATLTSVAATDWKTGERGQCLYFDQTYSDYASAPHINAYATHTGSEVTVLIDWRFTATPDDWGPLLIKSTGYGANNGFGIWYASSYLQFWTDAYTNAATYPFSSADRNWHTLIGERKIGNAVRVWVDGKEGTPDTSLAAVNVGTGSLILSCYPGVLGANCLIRSVLIWGRTLGSNEKHLLTRNSLSPFLLAPIFALSPAPTPPVSLPAGGLSLLGVGV